MGSVGDPVDAGFVVSLARPGGNITGVSNQAVEITGKWIELLKETVPTISNVAVLWNPSNPPGITNRRRKSSWRRQVRT
jgi:putative ABC transport system substrate-binding protein